jgi:hypothetical protein
MSTTTRLCLFAGLCLAVAVGWSVSRTGAQMIPSFGEGPPPLDSRLTPPTPSPGTIDDMLNAVGELRKQQADLKARLDTLVKQEQELKAALRSKLTDLQKRVNALDGDDVPPVAPTTPAPSHCPR